MPAHEQCTVHMVGGGPGSGARGHRALQGYTNDVAPDTTYTVTFSNRLYSIRRPSYDTYKKLHHVTAGFQKGEFLIWKFVYLPPPLPSFFVYVEDMAYSWCIASALASVRGF
jgi:hypothetical protein